MRGLVLKYFDSDIEALLLGAPVVALLHCAPAGSAVSKAQLGNPGRHRPLGPGSFSSVVGGTREFFDGLGCSPRAVDLPPPARL